MDFIRNDLRVLFNYLDTPKFGQSVVAQVVDVIPTYLNDWRNRGLIADNDLKNVGGRVLYNLRALFTAGVIAELSWTVGPAKAASIASWLYPTLETLHAAKDDEDAFNTLLDEIGHKLVVIADAERLDVDDIKVRDVGDLAAFCFLITLEDHPITDISALQRSRVTFPVGAMLTRWLIATRVRNPNG